MRGVQWQIVLIGVLAGLFGAERAHGQWVEAQGHGWVQLALYHHDTRRLFDTDGDTRPIFADGHAITTSLYVTATAGVVRGVDVWVQVPFHHLIFNDTAGNRKRIGLGDPRFYVRVGPSIAGLEGPVPVAIRAGVKWPGGDFPVDAEVIPLGEGQRDWELMLEFGYAFSAWPLYMMGWIGYRWREANEETARDPGNEVFAFAAAGGHVQRFTWKLAVEGWSSQNPVIQGVTLPAARRAMLQLLPHIGWQLGPGVLEVGGRLPLVGRNLPAGPALFIGYFFRWQGW